MKFVSCLEEALGIDAIKQYEAMQPGDVIATAADTKALEDWIDFKPDTPIEEGIAAFANWYKRYYKIQ